MQAVNSDADFLTRHAAQIASRFHHTAKILLTASPVWTLMTTAVPSRGLACSSLDAWPPARPDIKLNVGLVDFPYLRDALRALAVDQRIGANHARSSVRQARGEVVHVFRPGVVGQQGQAGAHAFFDTRSDSALSTSARIT